MDVQKASSRHGPYKSSQTSGLRVPESTAGRDDHNLFIGVIPWREAPVARPKTHVRPTCGLRLKVGSLQWLDNASGMGREPAKWCEFFGPTWVTWVPFTKDTHFRWL